MEGGVFVLKERLGKEYGIRIFIVIGGGLRLGSVRIRGFSLKRMNNLLKI